MTNTSRFYQDISDIRVIRPAQSTFKKLWKAVFGAR